VSAVASAPFAALAAHAEGLGLRLDPAQLTLCERYAAELIERNTSVNLTAITDPEAIATKHFLDSFTALAVRRWSGTERVVDVGSGAGFPGVALRVALPRVRLTCIESVGKKAAFIERTTALLGLDDVELRHERSETLAHAAGLRAMFDVGTARAVGSLATCAEYLLPLLRVGGDAIVWKGRIADELPAARRALAALGGMLVRIVPTAELGLADVLPGRNLVVMRKVRATADRFPRPPAEARRRPW